MAEKNAPWWGIDWWIWALGCLAVAAVYLVIDTEGASGPGPRNWVLRWGHGLCWLLLAVSFLLRRGPGVRFANLTAGAGGLVYLAFLVLRLTRGDEA